MALLVAAATLIPVIAMAFYFSGIFLPAWPAVKAQLPGAGNSAERRR